MEMSHDLVPVARRDSGVSHECDSECWLYGTEYEGWRLCNPLDVPLKLGWKRYDACKCDSEQHSSYAKMFQGL